MNYLLLLCIVLDRGGILNYYNEIKNKLINNEILKKVKDYSKNRSDLETYYDVGKLLKEAGKNYGDSIIKEYSKKLRIELGKGYSVRNLYNMRLFYEKVQTVSAKLSWSHYSLILSFENNKMNYYINLCERNNISVRELKSKIKSNEYERLDKITQHKLVNNDKLDIQDLIPNPILIRNKNNYDVISEKILKQLILEDIDNFLLELGSGFSYIGNEYKIKVGNIYNYIDLLLYNIKYKCYVVVELKVTNLKKEHIGQVQVYMNYIDDNIKTINENKTIGIVIVRKNNNYVIEYCSDDRVIAKEYELVR